MKKFFTILMVVIMTMALSAVALADDPTISYADESAFNALTGHVTFTLSGPQEPTVYKIEVSWSKTDGEYKVGTIGWNETTANFEPGSATVDTNPYIGFIIKNLSTPDIAYTVGLTYAAYDENSELIDTLVVSNSKVSEKVSTFNNSLLAANSRGNLGHPNDYYKTESAEFTYALDASALNSVLTSGNIPKYHDKYTLSFSLFTP